MIKRKRRNGRRSCGGHASWEKTKTRRRAREGKHGRKVDNNASMQRGEEWEEEEAGGKRRRRKLQKKAKNKRRV